MKYEYWFITLPVIGGKSLKGELWQARLNRELSEIVERGWEPDKMTAHSTGSYGFLFRKELSA